MLTDSQHLHFSNSMCQTFCAILFIDQANATWYGHLIYTWKSYLFCAILACWPPCSLHGHWIGHWLRATSSQCAPGGGCDCAGAAASRPAAAHVSILWAYCEHTVSIVYVSSMWAWMKDLWKHDAPGWWDLLSCHDMWNCKAMILVRRMWNKMWRKRLDVCEKLWSYLESWRFYSARAVCLSNDFNHNSTTKLHVTVAELLISSWPDSKA